MNILKTKIGDHCIHFNFKTINIKSMLEKYFYFHINVDEKLPDLVIEITDGYGFSFRSYHVEISKNYSNIVYRRADYLIEVDAQFRFARVAVHNELALKHALMNLYSSFAVHRQWGLLIHSSCVIENGEAHIFSGHSGAGKSTAAKLSYPRSLLSDEATLVKITHDDIQVFNSPFRSEMEADSYIGSIRLSSVQILYQALQNRRDKIAKPDALFQLIDKIFYWPHSQQETSTIIRMLTQLVKQAPVYELHFQKNNTFWELIS